jgi:hypothetical protein
MINTQRSSKIYGGPLLKQETSELPRRYFVISVAVSPTKRRSQRGQRCPHGGQRLSWREDLFAAERRIALASRKQHTQPAKMTADG